MDTKFLWLPFYQMIYKYQVLTMLRQGDDVCKFW